MNHTTRRAGRFGAVLTAGLLALALGIGPATAAGGSAYVTSSCGYPSLQDNSIAQGSSVSVWIKVTGKGGGSYTWTTVDNAGAHTQSGTLDWQECSTFGSKYTWYWANNFNSSVLGSYTLTVWDSNGKSVSGDAFRVVPSPD